MSGPTCLFVVERVTGIEPALSAWESVHSGPSIWPDLGNGLSVSDRESPRFTRVNGPLMARLLDHVEGRLSAFRLDVSPSRGWPCERLALSPVAGVSRWLLLLLSRLLSAAIGRHRLVWLSDPVYHGLTRCVETGRLADP